MYFEDPLPRVTQPYVQTPSSFVGKPARFQKSCMRCHMEYEYFSTPANPQDMLSRLHCDVCTVIEADKLAESKRKHPWLWRLYYGD